MKTEGTKQTKRARILAAATQLFHEAHNVRKVSIEDIAQAAGVSPTTIYNQFGTREALVGEVVRTLVTQSIEANKQLVRSARPFPEKLALIMGGKLELVGELDKEILAKMVSQDRGMWGYLNGIYEEEIKPLWREIIAQGKREGYIDPGLGEAALLLYLDVLKAGFATRPELTKNVTENVELLKSLSRLMFYGFLRKDINLFAKEGRTHAGP